ncbi:PIN domain-containing protein [Tersicoccus phoenicis]|uniref:VapC toxin family PIN domain ribonuclease n=1 Tax=Tersicoccus phoenicis TaxID=554083 RepID=UPI001C47C91D|nr:VapC toxin family PIN domain ribonuclease [Tersicoccus phoenicis]
MLSMSAWARDRSLTLGGHALAATYSVLTRLPGEARVSPADAVTLMDANVIEAVGLDDEQSRTMHRVLAQRGISGGAMYDGLVSAAASGHGLTMATRDAGAGATYEAIGVRVDLLA